MSEKKGEKLALASMSSESGSMPFWLMTTKLRSLSGGHSSFLKSMILRTLSSVNFRSAATNSSRSCAVLYTNDALVSLFSYSSDTFRIST